MSHAGHARNFESTIRGLAERGHSTTVAVDRVKSVAGSGTGGLLAAIEREFPTVSTTETPRVTADAQAWLDVARGARLGLDYLRYLEPPFQETPKLTARAFGRLRGPLKILAERARTAPPEYRDSVRRALRAVHDSVPPIVLYLDFIRDQSPDVVLVTPLLELGSHQHEQVRAARALGVPVVLLVHSWDNLTTKGLVHIAPDLIAVWNEAQRQEAIDLHGLDAERVVVTGAPAYDHWFGWKPSTTREGFCRKLGLDADRPFVVYLGSSAFIAPAEADTVLEWVEGLRAAPFPELRDVGIVVRPHPTNPVRGDRPAQQALESRNDVVLYPRDGQNPTDRESRQDYFDSLYHSAAVVGVNTSAFLESSILGRPAHTILWPEFRETQKGTLHFGHLTDPTRGLLHVAVSGREHAEQLQASIADAPEPSARSTNFVEVFIRPEGRTVPATPLLIGAIERAARTPAIAIRPRGSSRLVAWCLASTLRGAAKAPRGPVERAQAVGRRAQAVLRPAPEPSPKDKAAGTRPPAKKPKPARVVTTPPLGPPPDTLAAHHFARRAADDALRAIPASAIQDRIAQAQATTRRRLAELADRGRPVIAGPWTGEVGYELLYWIPLLAWATRVEPRLAEQLYVVSRGGAQPWYANLGAAYVDVLDLSPLEEYLERRTPQKQRRQTEYEAELLARAGEHFALDSAVGLLPSELFEVYFGGVKADPMVYARRLCSAGDGTLGWTSDYRPLPVERVGRPDWLPERYVAARFYHRESFPQDARVERFVAEVVATLAETTEVVLLDSGARMDEHADATTGEGPVHRMTRHVKPRSNLAQQTEVIAHADGFVGTYGGLSYLPPMLGVPSLAFSSTVVGLQPWHDALARALFEGEAWGSYGHHHIDELDAERIAEMVGSQAVRSR